RPPGFSRTRRKRGGVAGRGPAVPRPVRDDGPVCPGGLGGPARRLAPRGGASRDAGLATDRAGRRSRSAALDQGRGVEQAGGRVLAAVGGAAADLFVRLALADVGRVAAGAGG